MSSEVRLSNEANYLVTLLYKEYIDRRKSESSKVDAKHFYNGSKYVHEHLTPNWMFEDVDETCNELSNSKYLEPIFADDHMAEFYLTDLLIVDMEQSFGDKVDKLISTLAQLKSLLLF